MTPQDQHDLDKLTRWRAGLAGAPTASDAAAGVTAQATGGWANSVAMAASAAAEVETWNLSICLVRPDFETDSQYQQPPGQAR